MNRIKFLSVLLFLAIILLGSCSLIFRDLVPADNTTKHYVKQLTVGFNTNQYCIISNYNYIHSSRAYTNGTSLHGQSINSITIEMNSTGNYKISLYYPDTNSTALAEYDYTTKSSNFSTPTFTYETNNSLTIKVYDKDISDYILNGEW